MADQIFVRKPKSRCAVNPIPVKDQKKQIRAYNAMLFCQARGRRPNARASRQRNGTIVIAVLVCLAIATTILFGAIEVSLRQRRQVRSETQMEQTYWLLDAGIGAAIAKFDRARLGAFHRNRWISQELFGFGGYQSHSAK